MEAREAGAAGVVQRTGATLVPPYNHGPVIEGQGTLALELFEQVPPPPLPPTYEIFGSNFRHCGSLTCDDARSGDSWNAAAGAVLTVSEVQSPDGQTSCSLSGIDYSSFQRMKYDGYFLAGIDNDQHDMYITMSSRIRLQECALACGRGGPGGGGGGGGGIAAVSTDIVQARLQGDYVQIATNYNQ